MKLVTLLAAATCSSAIIAQTTVTVTTGPSNAQQSFYSLQNGVMAGEDLAEWDLAFEMAGFTSSILVNTAKGINAYETSATPDTWSSINAPDVANWTLIHNSETDWSTGALNNGNDLIEPDGVNVGWGIYNIITHAIAGNKVYVLEFPDATYRKLRIDVLAGGVFYFTYANLDGTDEQSHTIVKANFTGKNFAYWNMSTHAPLDREPAAANWDLLFTKYIGFVPTAYALAGVLQNKEVRVLQVDGVPTDLADAWSGDYTAEINTIGADWKSFNMTTFQYEYVQDRTYFVKDRAGNLWKLIFTGYGGMATGDITFTQELVSATGIDEMAAVSAVIYPNPVRDGAVSLVLDAASANITVSLVDLGGQVVNQQRIAQVNGLQQHQLNVGGLAAGLYTVRIQGDGINTATRLVIE